jgi:NADH-quinone oxidoreductase subunit E
MVNWEFMDNQTPESATRLVDDLREGKEVRSTRGPRICTWREAERVLAGFPDDLADEGPTAGPASLAGLEIARERGWTAPSAESAQEVPGRQPTATGGSAQAAERADTSRAESETKVEDSPAEVSHEDDAKGEDDK